MRELLCDGLRALAHLAGIVARNARAELAWQARQAEARRRAYLSMRWNPADDALFHDYAEHQ